MPLSVLYDNDKCLVARIQPDGTRSRTRLFSGFLSHYLIQDRYSRPGKGNDKGSVEGLVGLARRNFMVPLPQFASWDDFNVWLEAQCRTRQADILRGHGETIEQRLQRDLAAMAALPATTFDAYDQATARAIPARQMAGRVGHLTDWYQKGFSVGFTTAAALVHALMEARDERRLLRLQKNMADHKLLIIDELGFVPLSKIGAELLFELISQRYERGATLITSNLPFDEWTETFGSERLTGALLDRLTHHVSILEMNADSYRLGQSRARKA